MERLRHTLTPKIEFETRKWDRAYHYLNHYFKQTTPTVSLFIIAYRNIKLQEIPLIKLNRSH